MFRRLVCLLSAFVAVAATNGPHTATSAVVDARPLPFFYDLYTFRGTAASTAIIAAFAVSVHQLRREAAPTGVQYRFDVTLVLADTALRTVFRTDDSVFVGLPRPLGGEHLFYTYIEVQAPPSQSTLQRVIMTDATAPGIGQLYRSSFPIPDYSGTHLMLSDIALGQPGAKDGWKRGDVTLALLPTSQLPSSAFDAYYEIYNLPTGNQYATEISVESVPRRNEEHTGDRRPVRIRFSGEAASRADGTLAEMRRVETSLARGRYRITVKITDETTGQSATRSRLFEVRGWERGTTLVPALPRGQPPR